MRFSLASIFLAFVLVGLSLGVFGPHGLIVAALLLLILVYLRVAEPQTATLASWVFAAFAILLSIAVSWCFSFMPEVQLRANARAHCWAMLQRISKGLACYQTKYGALPALHEQAQANQLLSSWRVTLDLEDVPREYDYRESWNSPNNAALATTVSYTYTCPQTSWGQKPGMTSYLAVVGPDGDWLRAEPDDAQTANPVRIVEVPGSDVLWTEPRDISLDDYCRAVLEPSASSLSHWHKPEYVARFLHNTPPAIYAIFMDGGILAIRPNVPAEVLRAALLGDREKQKELDALGTPTLNWGKCAGLGLLIVLFVLMFVRVLRNRWVERAEQELRCSPPKPETLNPKP